ncbi:MAG: M14 family metallopeptidase [Balneolaceae bacterium]
MKLEQIPFYLLLFLIVVAGCKTQEFTGFSYDPEGGNITTDRVITPQHKRTFGFLSDGIWISNEYKGARLSDSYRIGKNHYRVIIQPENAPINNSPWYGFKVWADQSTEIEIELNYPESRQRYTPKLSRDGGSSWSEIDPGSFHVDTLTETGHLKIQVDSDTLWVSAQELETTTHFNQWLSELKLKPYVSSSTIGYSHQNRPVKKVKIVGNNTRNPKGVVILYGRQHPPEIPGYLVGIKFIQALAGDSETAERFRSYFDVWAFPMMNPDGVDNGHWRHNAAGVDLNRDWQAFNQPETRAVRDALLPLKDRSDKKVFYAIDFHSTNESIFYPINRDIDTFPQHFTYRWYDTILESAENVKLNIESFDTSAPIAKNWTWHTFGVDAVTFEVNDDMTREYLQEFARKSAETFMELMISEYENKYLLAKPVGSK